MFCLESYNAHRNLTGREVSALFERYGVFDYLREFFEVLHTTGHNYINHDFDLYLHSRGVVFPAK